MFTLGEFCLEMLRTPMACLHDQISRMQLMEMACLIRTYSAYGFAKHSGEDQESWSQMPPFNTSDRRGPFHLGTVIGYLIGRQILVITARMHCIPKGNRRLGLETMSELMMASTAMGCGAEKVGPEWNALSPLALVFVYVEQPRLTYAHYFLACCDPDTPLTPS